MMGDVARAPGAGRCGGTDVLSRLSALPEQPCGPARLFPAVGAGDQLEQVEDGAVLDDQAAVHIGFADAEPRVA